MHPAPFAYKAAHSVEEAIQLLRSHEDSKILAGGHSLIPALKLRLTQPAMLIDISKISSLRGIRRENGKLIIGSATTHREIEKSHLVAEASPLLASLAPQIGDVQVRHRGTFGGSLAHADPAGDWPAAALAVDAELVIAGAHGTRTVHAADFFTGMLTTVIHPDEILTEIRVPGDGTPGIYLKHRNAASGYATVGVAVTASHDHGHIGTVTIAVTGATSVAFRASGAEHALNGHAVSAHLLDEAASHAADGLECLSDIHAPAAYRSQLVKVMVRRALGKLLNA